MGRHISRLNFWRQFVIRRRRKGLQIGHFEVFSPPIQPPHLENKSDILDFFFLTPPQPLFILITTLKFKWRKKQTIEIWFVWKRFLLNWHSWNFVYHLWKINDSCWIHMQNKFHQADMVSVTNLKKNQNFHIVESSVSCGPPPHCHLLILYCNQIIRFQFIYFLNIIFNFTCVIFKMILGPMDVISLDFLG
jgi:hypothetical protein